MVHQYLPFLFDVVAQGSTQLSALILIIGLAVTVIVFASQSAQLTHRDSPVAVIIFAATSILLFTLPRVGGNSRLPHIAVLIFGLTTVLAYLLGFVPDQRGSFCRRDSRGLRLRLLDRKTSPSSLGPCSLPKSRCHMVARSRIIVCPFILQS
jgi:hypothetical protein